MEITCFQSDYIDEMAALWISLHPYDRINRNAIVNKLVLLDDYDPTGIFVARENGKIIGFLSAVRRRIPITPMAGMEEKEGWINAFVLAPGNRSAEAGAALLKAAEDFFIRHGKTNINTGYYPVYFTQGIDVLTGETENAAYVAAGYTYGETASMKADLTSYSEPSDIAPARKRLEEMGFRFGPLSDRYLSDCLTGSLPFMTQSWIYEFKTRIKDLDYGRIRIAEKDGKAIGACVFGDRLSDGMRFGPFGVSKEYRGLGLGKVLFADCIGEMVKRKLPSAWMQWVGISGVASNLYRKFGFEYDRVYRTYYKTLTGETK